MRLFCLLYTKLSGRKSAPTIVSPTAYRRIWGSLFGKYLLLTNTISSGFLMSLGDVVSQEIEYRKNLVVRRYDWKRIGKYFYFFRTLIYMHILF